MSHKFADRVADTTSTTGTGAFALDSAGFNAYRNFGDVCSGGDTIYYSAAHRVLNQWEVGNGTYGAGTNVLARTTVLASSNAGSAVNFSSGTKDIVAGMPATLAASPETVVNFVSGSPWVNVRDATYGATGNGATDDTGRRRAVSPSPRPRESRLRRAPYRAAEASVLLPATH